MQTSDCDAKASLSSTRSRSPTSIPARASALRVAGTGPTPMTAGSTPATAVESTRAIGRSPSARARSASTTSTAEAPSLMPDEFPAVTEPPSGRNAGRSFASASRLVSARGCSSRATDDRVAAPLRDLDRHDLPVEPAGLDRRDRALLALEREGVLALAAHAPALGDVLRGLAHGIRVVALGQPRVHEAPAERRVGELARAAVPGALGLELDVRGAGHRLDAAADEDVAVADRDRVRRGVDRLEPRPAQPVDRQPAHLDREVGEQQGHPRDVAVVLAGLVGAAQDHVLDERRVDAGAVDDRAQDDGREVVRADARERAAVAADRRADGLDDPGLADRSVRVSRHRSIVSQRQDDRVLPRWADRRRSMGAAR